MAVPTGITTEMIILDTLYFPFTMHCPACRQFHSWTRSDAWIAKDPSSELTRAAGSGV